MYSFVQSHAQSTTNFLTDPVTWGVGLVFCFVRVGLVGFYRVNNFFAIVLLTVTGFTGKQSNTKKFNIL